MREGRRGEEGKGGEQIKYNSSIKTKIWIMLMISQMWKYAIPYGIVHLK